MSSSTRSIRGLRPVRFLWMATLLVAAPTLLAGPQGYYRWKDDKGQFQATQQPPADRPSEFVRTSTGTASQTSADDKPAGTASGGTDNAPAANGPTAKPASLQALPDKDPEKCKQAQDTQQVLNSHARIREKDDKGDYRYLTTEEITDQKKLAEESIGIYCEPAAPAK